MESLSAELVRAREALNITLYDIADTTLINVAFLEKIEQGEYTFLPETYIRSFLREYAMCVGLDPDDISRKFTAQQSGDQPEPAGPSDEVQPASPTAPPPIPVAAEEEERAGKNLRTTRLATFIVLLFAAAVILWNLFDTRKGLDVKEIPFDDIIEEHQGAGTPSPVTTLPSTPTRTDSLELRATTTDAIWLQIEIDNGIARDYMLKANTTISWKAAREFHVSLGNAGVVRFSLNDSTLGTLGRPGAVIRNFPITADLAGRK